MLDSLFRTHKMQTITTCLLAASAICALSLWLPTNGLSSGHVRAKRSFSDIQCKGVYDAEIYAEVDQVCEDCYNLFKHIHLHTLCSQDCFTSEYFLNCTRALLFNEDEIEDMKLKIKILHGIDPGL